MTLRILVLLLLITGCAQAGKEQVQGPEMAEEISAPAENRMNLPAADDAGQRDLTQAPEEMLSSFSVSGYTQGGKKQWDLEGKSADIMTELIQLTDVRGKVYGEEMNMTIVADTGSLNRLDNNVHLEKNVQATTEDGTILTTDYLDWDAQSQELASDAPVWIKRGVMEASGTGIVGQPVLNFVELKKDVTVKIALQNKETSAKTQELDQPDESQAGALYSDRAAQANIVPTVITCAGPLEVEYEDNLAIFEDNVRVKDQRGEIFADKMDVYFSTQNENTPQIAGMEGMGIEKIVATGNVEIHHGGNTTYSQKAVYDTNTGKLTLTGEPKLVIYSTEAFNQLMGAPRKSQESEQD